MSDSLSGLTSERRTRLLSIVAERGLVAEAAEDVLARAIELQVDLYRQHLAEGIIERLSGRTLHYEDNHILGVHVTRACQQIARRCEEVAQPPEASAAVS